MHHQTYSRGCGALFAFAGDDGTGWNFGGATWTFPPRILNSRLVFSLRPFRVWAWGAERHKKKMTMWGLIKDVLCLEGFLIQKTCKSTHPDPSIFWLASEWMTRFAVPYGVEMGRYCLWGHFLGVALATSWHPRRAANSQRAQRGWQHNRISW